MSNAKTRWRVEGTLNGHRVRVDCYCTDRKQALRLASDRWPGIVVEFPARF